MLAAHLKEQSFLTEESFTIEIEDVVPVPSVHELLFPTATRYALIELRHVRIKNDSPLL
jgi:hypothetical protein